MEIKKVIRLQSSLPFAEKEKIVEVTFVFGPPVSRWQTVEKSAESNQKYERDADALLDFIRILPIGTVQELIKLFQKELGHLTPTADA